MARPVSVLALLALGLASAGCFTASQQQPSAAGHRAGSNEQKDHDRPEGVVGYYVLTEASAYGVEKMDQVPPGQIRNLGIENGRWMVRDFLVAIGGTYTLTEEGATLQVTEVPSGKADGKEELKATRTGRGVQITGGDGHAVHFTYLAPTAPDHFGYDEFFGTKK